MMNLIYILVTLYLNLRGSLECFINFGINLKNFLRFVFSILFFFILNLFNDLRFFDKKESLVKLGKNAY
jgi:hypothetical protein